jgi:signal transduction histidine kinase/CheY-like chemotaxis protein
MRYRSPASKPFQTRNEGRSRFALEELLWAGLAVLAFSALAAFVWHEDTKQREAVRRSVLSEQASVRLAPMAARLERVFEDVYHNARTISMLPGVRKLHGSNRLNSTEDTVAKGRLSADADQTIHQIYNNLASSVQVSEIYVILKGLQADRGEVPVLAYDSKVLDINSKITDIADIPQEDESAEYAYYTRTMAELEQAFPRFTFDRLEAIPSVWSPRMRTCDNTQYTSVRHGNPADADGISLSVPVYSARDEAFSGLVAVVLRTNVIESILMGLPLVPLSSGDLATLQRQNLTVPAEPVPFRLVNSLSGLRVHDRRIANPDTFFANGQERLLEQALEVHGNSEWLLQLVVPESTWQARMADLDASLRVNLGGLSLLALMVLGLRFMALSRRRQARAMRQLEVEREREVRANRAKDTFLANMSHEIRTPMNGVIGMLELLSDSALDQQQQLHLQSARGAAEDLLEILNDILDVTRLESGGVQLDIVRHDLHHLIQSAVRLIAHRAKKKGITVAVTIAPDTPRYLAIDPTRVRQIVLNLLTNAVKFTEAGNVDLRLSASSLPGLERVQIHLAVQDTGIGISPEAMPQLFQRFAQADKTTKRRFGGSGLGLEISHKLAQLMEGDITVQSQPGQGSTFVLTFPAAAMAPPPASPIPPPSANPDDNASDHPPVRRLRVLIVDDTPLNLVLLRTLLGRWGHEVVSAEGGEQAVQLATGPQPFDLVLMDAMMPEVDGTAACQRIREFFGDRPHPRIVVVTADAMVGARAQYLASGFDDYMAKPVHAPTLKKLVDQIGA